VNIGSNEIMELPWASDDLNNKYLRMMQTPPSFDSTSDGEDESETPLFDMSIKAEVVAGEAAEEMIDRLLKYPQQQQQQQERESGENLGGNFDGNPLWQELGTFLRNRYSAINSLKERGINPIASSGAGGRLAPSFTEQENDDDDDAAEMGKERFDQDNLTTSNDNIIPLVDCLRLEQQVWEEIDAVRDLAEKIAGRATPLADGLTCLRPPNTTISATISSGSSSGGLELFKEQEAAWKARNEQQHLEEMAGAKDPRGIFQGAHPGYPPLRRVQRLSFALASSLGDVSASEGRQAWLEVHSVAGRLRLGLSALRRHRDVLAAVVAVRNLSDKGGGSNPEDPGKLEN
jgi:hypothetical protein